MLLAALSLWVHACAGAPARTSDIACGECEGQGEFVRMEKAQAGVLLPAGQPLAHPFLLGPADWELILSSLYVQRMHEGLLFSTTTGVPEQAFAREEVGYLASTLSKAFARAEPDHVITFGVSRSSSPGITEVTSGGWYIVGRHLHLLVANYRHALTMRTVWDRINEHPLYPMGTVTYEFVGGAGIEVAQREAADMNPFKRGVVDVAIDYKALLLAQAGDGTESRDDSHTNRTQLSPAPPSSGPRSIEERLEILNRLKERGLISQSEYDSKRKQLLDNF